MGNSGTKEENKEREDSINAKDDDVAVRQQLVGNDEDDDDEDDDDERDKLSDNGGEGGGGGGGGKWEPGMAFPAIDKIYPVIRVISNVSMNSLKEVSTRKSKTWRKKRAGSVNGALSEATSFKIYSDTSASTKNHGSARPSTFHVRLTSESSDISVSDSASNSPWRNHNQNRKSEEQRISDIPLQSGGCPLSYRSIFAAFLFAMVVTGAVVLVVVFIFKTNDGDSTIGESTRTPPVQ